MGENLLRTPHPHPDRHIRSPILLLRIFRFTNRVATYAMLQKWADDGVFFSGGAGSVWYGQQRFCNTTHHFYCLSAARK